MNETRAGSYHRVQQLDAPVEFPLGLTEETKEKPTDGLLLTDANIVPFCGEKTQASKRSRSPTWHEARLTGAPPAHTDGVALLRALAYVREAKDLLPFFTPSLSLSSSTCGDKKETP